MLDSSELTDLCIDLWGDKFTTVGARLRSTEKKLQELMFLAYPKFEKPYWSPARTYEPFTFVHTYEGDSYVSIKRVPSGIKLQNQNYWVQWDVRDAFTQFVKEKLEMLERRPSNQLTSPDGTLWNLEISNEGVVTASKATEE